MLHAYLKAQQTDKATALLTELLDDARRQWPGPSPDLAQTLSSISMLLLDEAKDYVTAEPLIRECLSIRQQSQPDAWTTFNTFSLVGGSLLGQEKFREAEPLLLQGYEGMKARIHSVPVQGRKRLFQAIDRLIQLYTLTDQPTEVEKWQAESQWLRKL